MSAAYAHPEVLVSTDWVEKHRSDTKNIRIVESDEDVLLYATGHVPEAIKIDWINDLNDPVVRDYIDPARFAALCARHGISNDTTVVFYGDKNNWWACYAFWVFKLMGHPKCMVMDGGRKKWEAERRPMSTTTPSYPRASYTPPAKPDYSIRAFRDEVLAHMKARKPMVDVRSPQEFSGERTHMAEYPQEGVLRGGHIPGAKNVPWARAVAEDGTFKKREDLEAIYLREIELKPTDDVVAYCRIGERSSHTWFVLTYLLGFQKVRNYDGSWTEWGNSVGLPIEKTHVPK
ncbi:MAG: sulfurtransferase [Phycisphaeraceae bacterium]|nr:sulfurtransferase [Phycisphaerales bacterium]QOJ18891.1 MAG: sulfurtransferase [Phycisphaeraceae bacterium]